MDGTTRLSGKRILLGVSGSIAAYKAVDILRRLQEQGAAVSVVMTANAARFVSRLTFETLSGRSVPGVEFQDWDRSGIGHIDITDGLDLALVAPATANVIGKLAAGIADDTLTTALLAVQSPLLVAPAMNDRMYGNPVVQKNIAFLKQQGVRIIEPEEGPLACGAVGQGRLASVDGIVREVARTLSPRDLAGSRVLVTAGPTREHIDAVRFISNPSTGKMGYALAAAARARGGDVTLISGPAALASPAGVHVVRVQSADEMKRSVMEQVVHADIVIMAAAVSDFRPAVSFEHKIKKQEASTHLELARTEDILSALGSVPGARLLVGFAAETDNLLENAVMKMKAKNLDLIVANDVSLPGAGFGSDTNSVVMLDRAGGRIELPVLPKSVIAERILDRIVELKEKKKD